MDLRREKKLFAAGFAYIAGLDEAGRGCLAGPVFAASVMLGVGQKISKALLAQVRDSKDLSPQKRGLLSRQIQEEIEDCCIASVDNTRIDRINILAASLEAMRLAQMQQEKQAEYLMIDGKQIIPGLAARQEAIIKGDANVFLIACASILAKVARDEYMEKAHQAYPRYGFDKHKGYGTKLHFARIAEFGPCPLHRLSFYPFKARA